MSIDQRVSGTARMGSWGYRTFEDDIAIDWLEDLHDSDPIAFFEQCLDLSGSEYVEFLACVGVVCTAEMIHSLLSEPRPGLPEAAHQWLHEHHGLNAFRFVPQTILSLQRIMGPNSEMHGLWEDNEESYESWMSQMNDLLNRLESVPKSSH